MKAHVISNQWISMVERLTQENEKLRHDEGLDLMVRLCIYLLIGFCVYYEINPWIILSVILCLSAFDIIRRV
jgi:hypothetical protein